MVNKISEELLSLFEHLLRAQLNTIRQLRKAAGYIGPDTPKEKRMSHTDMAYDILKIARGPMHVNDIISAMEKNFHITVDRESLVSALAKRIARHDRFVKTAPNTFALLAHEVEGGER